MGDIKANVEADNTGREDRMAGNGIGTMNEMENCLPIFAD